MPYCQAGLVKPRSMLHVKMAPTGTGDNQDTNMATVSDLSDQD